MKRRIARVLRRAAHRLDPDAITSWEISWRRMMPPHVDILLRRGQRVTGYVDGQARVDA